MVDRTETDLPAATLFVIATPIGNLDDLSPRACRLLGEVDLIAAEDTRHTGRLLAHFGIKTPQIAFHEHNEDELIDDLLARLQRGQSLALVSDAGTPLISDPGYRLLRAAHRHAIRVCPVPGASAIVSALSVAGLPTDRFSFEGFLPAKKVARIEKIKALSHETRTMVFFESVHRVDKSLADLAKGFGPSRRAFIGRELSKMHEQCVLGTLGDLVQMFESEAIMKKGEFVIVVDGAEETVADVHEISTDSLLQALSDVVPGSQAVALTSTLTGVRKNELYQRMLKAREETE